MLRVALQLIVALFGALPELIKEARAWKLQSDAAKRKTEKDDRNEAAIKAAQQSKEPKP